MEAEPNLSLSIRELNALFYCGICYSEFKDPTVTPCGHTFCKVCIERWLSSNDSCPECKRSIDIDELVKNYIMDRALMQIGEIQKKAINKPLHDAMESRGIKEESPFISAFVNTLKNGIGRFEDYCDEVKNNTKEEIKKIKKNFEERRAKDNTHIAEINEEEKKELEIVTNREKVILKDLVTEYQEYINKAVVEPNHLPILINIKIPSKSINIPNIKLNPRDSLIKIKEIVEKEFEKMKFDILEWSEEIVAAVMSPDNSEVLETYKLNDPSIIIYKTKLIAGCTIEIRGSIADRNSVCVSYKFDPGKKRAFNYYRCNDCGYSWICEQCINKCHAGHNFKLHIPNHVPDRACCYCVKHNCLLPNKKTNN